MKALTPEEYRKRLNKYDRGIVIFFGFCVCVLALFPILADLIRALLIAIFSGWGEFWHNAAQDLPTMRSIIESDLVGDIGYYILIIVFYALDGVLILYSNHLAKKIPARRLWVVRASFVLRILYTSLFLSCLLLFIPSFGSLKWSTMCVIGIALWFINRSIRFFDADDDTLELAFSLAACLLALLAIGLYAGVLLTP